jgi:Asp-tRNA(Asn)/Glu-tRNA(Gln) amidotransferase A subunit family amidase
VPIALKDLVDLEGRVTTGGSKVWADRVSPVTATLAERLIAAGMIVLGKTHTVEFAMGSFGTNTISAPPESVGSGGAPDSRRLVERVSRGGGGGLAPWPSAPTPAAPCACPRPGVAPWVSR